MINAHINRQIDRSSRIPLWAAFGAPLVGVPILVVVLALGTRVPATSESTDEVEASYVSEQLEADAVGAALEMQVVIEDAAQLES